jgi:hypothetical protein
MSDLQSRVAQRENENAEHWHNSMPYDSLDQTLDDILDERSGLGPAGSLQSLLRRRVSSWDSDTVSTASSFLMSEREFYETSIY